MGAGLQPIGIQFDTAGAAAQIEAITASLTKLDRQLQVGMISTREYEAQVRGMRAELSEMAVAADAAGAAPAGLGQALNQTDSALQAVEHSGMKVERGFSRLVFSSGSLAMASQGGMRGLRGIEMALMTLMPGMGSLLLLLGGAAVAFEVLKRHTDEADKAFQAFLDSHSTWKATPSGADKIRELGDALAQLQAKRDQMTNFWQLGPVFSAGAINKLDDQIAAIQDAIRLGRAGSVHAQADQLRGAQAELAALRRGETNEDAARAGQMAEHAEGVGVQRRLDLLHRQIEAFKQDRDLTDKDTEAQVSWGEAVVKASDAMTAEAAQLSEGTHAMPHYTALLEAARAAHLGNVDAALKNIGQQEKEIQRLKDEEHARTENTRSLEEANRHYTDSIKARKEQEAKAVTDKEAEATKKTEAELDKRAKAYDRFREGLERGFESSFEHVFHSGDRWFGTLLQGLERTMTGALTQRVSQRMAGGLLDMVGMPERGKGPGGLPTFAERAFGVGGSAAMPPPIHISLPTQVNAIDSRDARRFTDEQRGNTAEQVVRAAITSKAFLSAITRGSAGGTF